MSWNENGEGNGPWNRKQNNGPPNLDELLKKFFSFFISKRRPTDQPRPKKIIIISFLSIFILWLLSGFFIIAPAERAVILRFGRYSDMLGPGPHWIPRVISSKYIVDVQKIDSFSYQAEMLTRDENIVSVDLSVQYRVAQPRDYLFNVIDPLQSIQQATASALREVVGHTTLDAILTTGRQQLRDQVSDLLQKTLVIYQTGLVVVDVNLQPAKPPEQVIEAFDDAIKAREDEQRYINKAQAYYEQVVAAAVGQSAAMLQAAEADKQKMILQAKGATSAFLALLPEYQKAPDVTRERLYLDAFESILSKTTKILVDGNQGQNLLYLPFDKLFDTKPRENQASVNQEIHR